MALAKEELGQDFTPGYEVPTVIGGNPYMFHINPNRPLFRTWYIPWMMRDPRLRFGIKVLQGRILQNMKIEVNSYESVVGDIVNTTFDRFMENAAASVLHDMFVFGYSGQEVIYYMDQDSGQWVYDKLKYISPYDTSPVSRDGNLIGMNVRRTKYSSSHGPQFVPLPKAIWVVHEPEVNRWFGRTRLYGSFEPWWEKWSYRGARDLRANWFYRCAFRGPKIGYPPGSTPIQYGTEGTNAIKKIPNRNIATELADKMQSGGACVYPVASEGTNQQWIIDDSDVLNVPEGLAVYLDNLDQELLEGLGIPPEILISDGTGAYAGRQVPNEAFVSVLEEPAKVLKNAICEGICDPLIYLYLHKRVRYDVKVVGLVESIPTASDGMYPSDVLDHQDSVEAGTAGNPNDPKLKVIGNSPQRMKGLKNGSP